MDAHPREAERLRQDVEWALRRALDPGDVLPLLHRLARAAEDGSDESVFAHRHLAELLVERDPWRAALHARRVLAARPSDDRGWAMLGLTQTLLGFYRYAVAAYHHALESAPANPWYAHNLGHLLDIALDRPKEAVAWLRSAYSGAAWSGEIAASYAHALARTGEARDLAEAKRVVTQAMKKGASREHAALLHWLEQGAPAGQDKPPLAPAGGLRARSAPRLPRLTQDEKPRRRRVGGGALKGAALELDGTLTRGLASLPLDAKQRAHAKELARDALVHLPRRVAVRGAVSASRTESAKRPVATDVESLAAAIAYAIVYVDHVPLKPAEVAACFRVSVASLRGRFGELRAQLDLMPGDARYASR